ncbi:response regulator [Lachnospiraceae bacterium]|nr:response regulator [Lachnospiraceae bacterium]
MLNIMLVDDEVLALQYLKSIVDWEAFGYHIAGCAASGKRALELYEETVPEIVISDIRMPLMDGLELTRRLVEKNRDVEVILLSAYGDFEYAKKGIEYGVSEYLLKHELSEELLLEKLNAVRQRIQKKNRREKIYQKYFMEELIYHPARNSEAQEMFSNRLFLVLCHKRSAFCDGKIIEGAWSEMEREILAEAMEEPLEDKIFYVADVQLAPNNWLVLYRIENTASKFTVNALIEKKCAQIGARLKVMLECRFHLIYSFEIAPHEIGENFRKMSRQIRYAMFFPSDQREACTEISVEEGKNIQSMEEIRQLKECISNPRGDPAKIVRELFYNLCAGKDLDACKSLIIFLNGMLLAVWEKEHIEKIGGEQKRYTINEITSYFEENFQNIHNLICGETAYSELVQEIIRYIRKNYKKDVSLDELGKAFQMNGVYLGQIFRKETGTTFLKYLTEVRIEEAKRLLKETNISVSDTAERVGYHTSQYFCKVFAKSAGMTPWEYKRCKEKN